MTTDPTYRDPDPTPAHGTVRVLIADHDDELSPCCGAMTTYHDADLICKACYELVVAL